MAYTGSEVTVSSDAAGTLVNRVLLVKVAPSSPSPLKLGQRVEVQIAVR